MIYHVTIGAHTFEVEMHGTHLTVDGKRLEADLGPVSGGPVRSLLVGAASRRVAAVRRFLAGDPAGNEDARALVVAGLYTVYTEGLAPCTCAVTRTG